MYDRIVKDDRIISYEEENNGIKVFYDNGNSCLFDVDRQEEIRNTLRNDSKEYSGFYNIINDIYKDKVTSIIFGGNAVASAVFLGITSDPIFWWPLLYCSAFGIVNVVFYKLILKQQGYSKGIPLLKLRKEVKELDKYRMFFEKEDEILEFLEKGNTDGNLNMFSFSGDINDLSKTKLKEMKKIIKLTKK